MDGWDYRPKPEVLARLKNIIFVAVVGPTASGKSTLIKGALARESSFKMVRNHTSRPPREGEQDRSDYYFHPRQEMEWRIRQGEYVQVAPNAFGDLYATGPEDYPEEGIAVMPILADAVPIFRALPFKEVRTIFVVPPDWDLWQRRINNHRFTLDKLERRLQEAERSLAFGASDAATKLLVDLDVETGVDDFITLALNRTLPPRLQADQQRGREIARELFVRLHGPDDFIRKTGNYSI